MRIAWPSAVPPVVVALLLGSLHAQGSPALPGQPAPQGPTAPPQRPQVPPQVFEMSYLYDDLTTEDDYFQQRFTGGFAFRWPALDLEIRGQSALMLYDRDGVEALIGRQDDGGNAPPRRGIALPAPRRRLTPEWMHERLGAFLRALGQVPAGAITETQRIAYSVPRFLYFEGGVIVTQRGVEVARCQRLWISPLEDRMVLEGAELRYTTASPGRPPMMFVVRGPRLEKQGPRWTGRDLQITSCTAGEPHFAVASGEVEIIERGDQFEIRSRGNTLQFSGVSVLPLPNAHVFTGEQSEVPVRSVSAGYGRREGMRTRVELGLPWNRTGGALHEWLTGRPAHEFRGDWRLGLGWIQERGFPIDGTLTYGADDLYFGQIEGFWLHDSFDDIREITTNVDGSPIDEENRTLLRTQNRVRLGETTHLDLVAFRAGDPAVYSEFFPGDYRSREVPETAAYLHHRSDNVLVTVNTRTNLDDFSYRSNRALADFFVEELPVATLHWLAQPIATTPWETPIVLDTATEIGLRRRDHDPLATGSLDDEETLRADQLVELSAPFHLGSVQLRPFANVRGTYWDEDVTGEAEDRVAFTAGFSAGTRLSRTFHWLGDDGKERAMRHVLAPKVTWLDRFEVTRDPTELRQFDEVDAIDERNLVRFEVRNLLQRVDAPPSDTKGVAQRPPTTRDFLFLDLAQDVFPDPDRDNAGEELGLFYYDFLIRPGAYWTPFETFAVGIYGDHDWREGLRTFDAELLFGPLAGLTWQLEYRRDAAVDGVVGLGAIAKLLGRWELQGLAQYDIEREDWLVYGTTIRRRDHDWTLEVGFDYEPFADQVNFRVMFEPDFGGLLRRNRNTWFGGDRVGLETGATSY